jgi:4-hydroxybenzoate polyprenyltransferase
MPLRDLVKDPIHAPLPTPPEALRRGPLKEGFFTSPLHDLRITARLGRLLGISFGICFLTGLYSHLLQHQPSWVHIPTHPASLYRVTQGLHVISGIASVPLLIAKLWSVYPSFFSWPPARDLGHAVERASLFLLVGGSLFQLTSGILNTAQWYELMGFNFTRVHYWTGWVVMGALVAHIGAKVSLAKVGLSQPLDEQ